MHFRGKHRLLNLVTPTHGTKTAMLGTARIEVQLDDYIGRTIFMGCYEPHNTRLLRTVLRPGDTFVDVGANIGYFSLLAAQLVGPKGAVYAFEPFAQNFADLEKNVERNGYLNVKCFGLGCSDTSEPTFISQIDQRLFPNRTATMVVGPGAPDHVTEKVDNVRLDNFLLGQNVSAIRCMKIDTDGWDHKVLLGAKRLLELGAAGRRRVLDRFQWTHVVGRCLDAYDGR